MKLWKDLSPHPKLPNLNLLSSVKSCSITRAQFSPVFCSSKDVAPTRSPRFHSRLCATNWRISGRRRKEPRFGPMDFVDLDSSPTLDQKKADNKYMKFQCCCFFVEKGEGGGVVKYLIYPVVLSFRMHGRCGWSFPKDGRYSMVFVGADSLISIIGPPETRWFPCIPCEPVKSSHFHETWCWDFHKESLKLYELYDCLTEMMRYKSKIIENSSKTKFPLPINGSCLALPWELWEGFGLFSRTHRKGHHFRSVPSASEDAGRLKTSPEVHGEGLCEFFVDGLWKTWIYRFRLVENYLEAKWSLVLKVNPKTRPGLNSNQTRVTWVPGIDMVFIFTRPFPNEGHVFLISTWPWKGQLQQDLRDGHKLIGHRAALMKGFTWKKLETKSSNKL